MTLYALTVSEHGVTVPSGELRRIFAADDPTNTIDPMSDDHLLRERFCAFIEQNRVSLMRWAEVKCHQYPPPPAYSADDLLHDVIVEASGKLDPKKGETAWKPWLYALIERRAIDLFRRGLRSPVKLADDVATAEKTDIVVNTASETPSPAEFDDLPGDVRIVRQALAGMKKPQERRLLELYYYYDGDQRPTLLEVAAAMDISPSCAKKLHGRALKSLKKLLHLIAKRNQFPNPKAQP